MTIGPSTEAPTFFVDRSLGRHAVPAALRAAGATLVTLAEVYGVPADEGVEDEQWLERAGTESWPVLMKDERIRRRTHERAVLFEHGVQAFCLTNGNLTSAAMADIYVRAWPSILHAVEEPGPFLYAVSRTGLRRITLTLT